MVRSLAYATEDAKIEGVGKMYDILILGGGSAGMGAALSVAREIGLHVSQCIFGTIAIPFSNLIVAFIPANVKGSQCRSL